MPIHIKPRDLAFFAELKCDLLHRVTQSNPASPCFLLKHPHLPLYSQLMAAAPQVNMLAGLRMALQRQRAHDVPWHPRWNSHRTLGMEIGERGSLIFIS